VLFRRIKLGRGRTSVAGCTHLAARACRPV